MNKKSSSKTIKKYPDLVYQNKALCKAVSLLPTTTTSSIPAIYIKSLPMVIGVAILLVLIILPTTRNASINFTQNISSEFSLKTEKLKSDLAASLYTGVAAYINQIENNINILPIDSETEPKNYLGRVETRTFSEKAHFMTASISSGLEYFK